jgi:hypothetical protein
MVTGAAGSIGHELSRQLLHFNPSRIVPLSYPVFGHKAEKIISFLGYDGKNFPENSLSELRQLPLL